MTRRLSHLNLCGVLALAVLCAVQWSHDRRLNLAREQSEQNRWEQAAELTSQTNQIKGLTEDLGRFKSSLLDEQQQRLSLETRLRGQVSTNDWLTAEEAQLKAAMTNWMQAVAVRDEHLQEANQRIERLSANLNASVEKFNALVTNYNAVVQEINNMHTNLAPHAVTNTTSR